MENKIKIETKKISRIQFALDEFYGDVPKLNNNFFEFETVNFYYDDGQKEISDSLKFIIEALYSNSNVILVNKKTRLFEVADYAGEIALLSQKLKFGYLTKAIKLSLQIRNYEIIILNL